MREIPMYDFWTQIEIQLCIGTTFRPLFHCYIFKSIAFVWSFTCLQAVKICIENSPSTPEDNEFHREASLQCVSFLEEMSCLLFSHGTLLGGFLSSSGIHFLFYCQYNLMILSIYMACM